MKKLTLLATLAVVALLFASCNKIDYPNFVGTWGVEKIEYYNIDYAGNPIAASLETHIFDPDDTNNGVHLIFKENKSGEMRDSSVDTVWYDWNNETQVYESYVVNPDTVLVYPFTCSYDKSDRSLYMNMDYGTYMRTFRISIQDMTDNSFIYENEYDKDYMEKAFLKRISDKPTKSATRKTVTHPHKPGSLLGGR
jgi:hypothetical protein